MVPNAEEKAEAAWVELSQAQKKKMTKLYQQHVRKTEKGAENEAKKAAQAAIEAKAREANLAAAKKIVLELDESLPEATTVKIRDAKPLRDSRITVNAWIHRIRRQGNNLMFLVVRDGTGYLQCVLTDKLCQTYDALVLQPEATVELHGKLEAVPEGKNAEGGHELKVDFWKMIANAPPGGVENVVNKEADPDTLFDNRHLVIRGEKTSKILKIRSHLMQGKFSYKECRLIFFSSFSRALFRARLPRGDSTLSRANHVRGRFHLVQVRLLRRGSLFDAILAALPRNLYASSWRRFLYG